MSDLFRKPSNGVFADAEARNAKRGAAIAKIIMLTITGFIIGVGWLSAISTVPELVRAQGELKPEGYVQQIQTPGPGVVTSVEVAEGERVARDQILAVLSSVDLEQSLRDIQHEIETLAVRRANLERIIDAAEDPSFIAVPGGQSDLLDFSYANAQLDIFLAQQSVQQKLRKYLASTQKKLEKARNLTSKRIETRSERVARSENLHDLGLTTRRELELQLDSLDQLQANLIEIDIRLSQSAKDLSNATAAIEQNRIALLEKTNNEMFDLDMRKEKLETQAEGLLAKRETLTIRAPAAGFIHAIGFPNPGEVIATGATLFELMPTDLDLVAQLEIDPKDIGHIKLGDAVALKFDTFDARRFGQLGGHIASISPDTVIDTQTGLGHFRATVALDHNSIGHGHWERPLQAGMGTTAEIVTDERTVLAYLMKPISRSLSKAFGER